MLGLASVTRFVSWSSFNSSSSSSCIAFSATGFLFLFFTLPISIDRRCSIRVGSLDSLLNPGAWSVRTTATGPSRGRRLRHKRIRPFRNSLWSSSSMRHAEVYEVTVSRTTRIFYWKRLITSAAKDRPTTGGGLLVVDDGSLVVDGGSTLSIF